MGTIISSFTCLFFLAVLQNCLVSGLFPVPTSLDIHSSESLFWKKPDLSDLRVKRQSAATTTPQALAHRPTFFLNNVSSPGLSATLELISSLVPLDSSFGIHQIALLNSPASIQDVEEALHATWWASNTETSTALGGASLVVRVLHFRDYGLFSDMGLPVIDVTYVVGLNRSNVAAGVDISAITLRIPDIGSLSAQFAVKNIQLCDCDVREGFLLHVVGITSIIPNVTAYRSALKAAWLKTVPELSCPTCSTVDIQLARTVITVGDTGVRLTTAPYVVLLNGHVWNGSAHVQPQPAVIESALMAQNLPVKVYRGTDTVTYAALAFVTYLNANIQFQDIPAVQRTVQSYVNRALPKPPLQVSIWNLEPFLNPQASVITQSSYFLTAVNGSMSLDPRLFYAPPIIDVMSNQTDGNITTVTGGTLGIFPLYLTGSIQANQLRSIAEILKITYAESNPGLNQDEVDVAIVSLDDGISLSPSRRAGEVTPVTELHVSAMVGGVDPDRIPHLSPFHQLLSNPASQDALNARLQAFNTAVCNKDCQFRKLRTLNLLQVDPSTSTIPDAQAVLEKTLAAWTLANPQSAQWVPLDVSLVSRDDSLANENGTLVSQLTYSVGYPLPAFNWYIPRDPDNRTLEQQLSLIKAVPFFGVPLHPQQIVLNRQLTAPEQQIFATAAMKAWADDKEDLRQCQQPNANCFVAVVDAENPAVSQTNGSPQYLYKYYILVDDKVYVPSSSLSPAQLVRLRSALDSGSSNNGSGGGPVVPVVVPIGNGPSSSTPAPLATPAPSAVVIPLLQQSSIDNFNLSDTINLAVGTQRQRNQALEQIAGIWQTALQPNVSNIHISTLQDNSGFPNPQTPDGRPIRTVTYLLQGTSSAPVDLNLALQRFRQLLPTAGIASVMAANPDMTTSAPSVTVPPYVVVFGKTQLNDTTAAAVIPTTPSTTTRDQGVVMVPVIVIPASTTTTAPGPILLSTPPILVGPGPFVINDTIVVTADTRRARDRVMEEQIRPVWQNVFGGNVSSFQFTVQKDTTFSTPQTPDGVNIRLLPYQVVGVAKTAFDSEAAKQQFHQQVMATPPRSVWAVSDNNGGILLLSTLPLAQPATTVSTTFTSAAVVIVPVVVPVSTSDQPPRQLTSYVGSLSIRNYNPSDQEAITQTLQQLWTQALETNDSNVLMQYLPTSGNTTTTGADGLPQTNYDFRYALFTNSNGTHPETAWPKFLTLLRQSDLIEYISQLPVEAPAAQRPTATSSTGVVVIPVLSFTEKQDIALNQPSEIQNVTEGLRDLWANAGGVPPASSEVHVISQVPLDPARNTAAGAPIQTLTYGVTLQNSTDLPAVRARAETLLIASPLLRQYLVLPEQSTSTSTLSSVVILIPGGASAASTLAPVLGNLETVPPSAAEHTFDGYVTSAQDVVLTTEALRTLWAQAYSVPPQSVNLTVLNVGPLPGAISEDHPVTRIQYAVQVPGQAVTPAVQQAFQQLLPQSSLTTIMAPVSGGVAPLKSSHSLRIAAANASDMDKLTNGIRNSWVTALGLQAQPQAATITFTNVQPENTATQNGVPISALSYDLQVPSTVVVGPNQEAAFKQLLLQSPAAQYVAHNTTPSVVPVVLPVPLGQPVPFSFVDSAAITATSTRSRDRILGQVKGAWESVLSPGASNVQLTMNKDDVSNPPTTPDGVALRNVTYTVSGLASPTVDEYDAKLRFRQLQRTTPTPGVFLVSHLDESLAPTTTTSRPTDVIILAVASTITTVTVESTSIPSSSSPSSKGTVPLIIPASILPVESTTIPLVTQSTYMQFLHLKRPVGPLDEETLRRLIADAWAQQNNQSASDITVSLLRNQPVADANGALGSNVTYEVTGPAEMAPPSVSTSDAILGKSGWSECRNCFSTPVHEFYLGSDGPNKTVDPMSLRSSLNQAVIAANPEVPSAQIQAAFPQNSPPLQSDDVSTTGQDLLLLKYFAVNADPNGQVFQVREPSQDQIQSQFPGQTVYPANSLSIVRPIRLALQNNGSWTDGTSVPLDSSTSQQVQAAVDSAIQTTSKNHSLNCAGSQLLKSKNLYGLFGRQYTQLFYRINGTSDSCSHLPLDVINEIARTAQATLNSSSTTTTSTDLTSVAPVLVQSTISATDPNRVYYHDYAGRLNIFDLQARKSELSTAWLEANPNCRSVECSYSSQILATQRRLSLTGSDITRVYFTIHSTSPYVVYPPQADEGLVPSSRAVQRLTLLPERQRRQSVTSISNSISNVNDRACFNPQTQQYILYSQADFVTSTTQPDSKDVPRIITNGTASQWNLTNCMGCNCDIPVYMALVQGHVNITNATEQAILRQELLQLWLNRYGNVTQDVAGILPSSWSSYIINAPNYRFHDASENPLSLVRYGIQVANGAPSELLIPDLTQGDLQNASDPASAFPICASCTPRMNDAVFLANLPPNYNLSASSSAPVAGMLTQVWKNRNPAISDLDISSVALNPFDRYSLLSNGSGEGPLQRLDYVLGFTPNTSWTNIGALEEPTSADLSGGLQTVLNNPNITAYPSSLVHSSPDRLFRTNVATGTPNWLPAAIILPLAGLIALTLLLVCLITRASRIFRSKKTVVITDPSMIQTIGHVGHVGHESPFKDGKSNMGFDDYRNVGRQGVDVSKVSLNV
ncbi:hypothetical protein BV898_00022 [Hypsibius exemplaris]|uniref:Uncharacterized protein n=1 Tax=Hypsibius exemplaris TaxID=2072580 RepID=A0A1W0XEH9_HYPEX|nr:hypothetical protein BV898_00022 [Hypsibius exemplaris]